MSKKVINIGTTPDDGTGDTLRSGAQKINDNFTELYTALGANTGAPINLVSSLVAGPGIAISTPSGVVTITNKIASGSEVGGIKIGTGLSIDAGGVVSTQVYSLPTAASNILGGIKIGSGLTIDGAGVVSATAATYTLPTATNAVLGGVKVGSGLTISNGVLSTIPSNYVLPTAAPAILGGVKVGARLSIDNDGVLSADLQTSNYVLPTATETVLGGVKVDGVTITISNGTISSAAASSRTTKAGTAPSLANNATGNLTITGFKSYGLYKIQTSHAAWVRIYTDPSARTADASRLEGADPAPDAGVIAEAITTGAQTVLLSPGAFGFNNEATPTENIYVAVTNKSGSTAVITVTLTVLRLEA